MIINLVQEARRLAINNGVSNKTLIFLRENVGALTAIYKVSVTLKRGVKIGNYLVMLTLIKCN